MMRRPLILAENSIWSFSQSRMEKNTDMANLDGNKVTEEQEITPASHVNVILP